MLLTKQIDVMLKDNLSDIEIIKMIVYLYIKISYNYFINQKIKRS